MRTVHDAVLWFHVSLGFLALAAFWVPALTRKGGRTHRRTGWVYVGAMLGVVLSAMLLAAMSLINPRWVRDLDGLPPERAARVLAQLRAIAFFLLGLALLTFTAGWQGLRVLWARRRGPRFGVTI